MNVQIIADGKVIFASGDESVLVPYEETERDRAFGL